MSCAASWCLRSEFENRWAGWRIRFVEDGGVDDLVQSWDFKVSRVRVMSKPYCL
jgi:hypothetical protein